MKTMGELRAFVKDSKLPDDTTIDNSDSYGSFNDADVFSINVTVRSEKLNDLEIKIQKLINESGISANAATVMLEKLVDDYAGLSEDELSLDEDDLDDDEDDLDDDE